MQPHAFGGVLSTLSSWPFSSFFAGSSFACRDCMYGGGADWQSPFYLGWQQQQQTYSRVLGQTFSKCFVRGTHLVKENC